MDEEQLLRRAHAAALAGLPLDEELKDALDQLFASYRPRLVQFCGRYVGDPRRGEEIAHEAIAIAWSRFDTFEFRGSFLQFLVAIARNLIRNERRRLHAHLTEDGVLETNTEEHNALALLRDEEQESLLLEAIKELPKLEQEAIYSRYCDGLTYAQIDAKLGLNTRSGARGLLVTARRHLKDRLRAALISLGHGSSFFRTTDSVTPSDVSRLLVGW